MPQQRVIIVSGGSRGLGAAIVAHLLDNGDVVATISRRPSEAVDRWRSDRSIADRFVFQQLDVTDSERLKQFVEAVHDRFGRIDALVNNAAVAGDGLLATADEASLERMLDVNLKGMIRLTRECVRLMLLASRGCIVNVASIAALRGAAGLSIYSATKAGVVGFTRSLAREVGPRGIRVNAVAPGYLETDMSAGLSSEQRERIVRRTPLGRLGTVGDVVPCVEFLLGEASGFMTGQVLAVDGGASV